jgi:cytochrome P450
VLFTASGRSLKFDSAGWIVTLLGCHPQWQEAALSEVRALALRHGISYFNVGTSGVLASSVELLASIPLSAWESETPILDAIIRETLRIAQPHVAMRRNVGPEIYVDGKVIPTGTFVVYPFSEVHVNPDIYPEPWKFDPSREPAKGEFTYIGWGGGLSFFIVVFFRVATARYTAIEY